MGFATTSPTHRHLCASTLPSMWLLWVNCPCTSVRTAHFLCTRCHSHQSSGYKDSVYKDFTPTFTPFLTYIIQIPLPPALFPYHTKIHLPPLDPGTQGPQERKPFIIWHNKSIYEKHGPQNSRDKELLSFLLPPPGTIG